VSALLFLCRALEGQDRSLGQRRAVSWARPIDWNDGLAVALELWVMPSLGCAAPRIEGTLPAHAAELSRQYYRVNTVRNLRFRHELTEAVQALNAAGVVPLLFKGALQLVDGTAVSLGNRGMADLDLAVPTDAIAACVEALRGIGYEPDPENVYLHPHAPTKCCTTFCTQRSRTSTTPWPDCPCGSCSHSRASRTCTAQPSTGQRSACEWTPTTSPPSYETICG
jgi:hypothetical protein